MGVPEVYCCDEGKRKALKDYCPILFEPYYPTIWAPQAHMQSIGRAVVQTFPEHPRRRLEKTSVIVATLNEV